MQKTEDTEKDAKPSPNEINSDKKTLELSYLAKGMNEDSHVHQLTVLSNYRWGP